ncbi:MAG TPA: DNA primase [Candidatus Bathyarchaeia archaeon]|nr:DNA primase [Candidatus Bathyarchaeia archaeon]
MLRSLGAVLFAARSCPRLSARTKSLTRREPASAGSAGLNTKKFSSQIVSDVLSANDIVGVIGGYLELKPAGTARFKALCPFHNEKTPSFTVSRDRQIYYCFGCEKHGDAIGFLQEYEGLTFYEALRKLADRVGIRLPAATERDNKDEFLRTQLVELNKFASAHFAQTLDDPLKGSACRHYMKTRSLKQETTKKFGLGYAPDGWSVLLEKARAAGFKDTVLESSGLVKHGERGSLYDVFRNRLMIPIRDVSGNIVAFGGRDLGDATPKYINSPENALYKKSRVLYGLFEARDGMKREKRAILVEGYFDLMRCFDAGIDNVVASCGTALTPDQAALIHRYVREVVVVFDADAAGIRAAIRGVGVLANAGLTVRAMTLPDGKDPDDYITAHSAAEFRQLVDNAADLITFYIGANAQNTSTIEGRTSLARDLFGLIAVISDPLQRDEYLKLAAASLRLDYWRCRDEFTQFVRDQQARQQRPATTLAKSVDATKNAPFTQHDRDFIAAVLSNDSLVDKAQETLKDVPLPAGPVGEILRALFDGAGADVARRLDSDEARDLYAAAATGGELAPDVAEHLVVERVAHIVKQARLAEAVAIQQQLQDAERANDQVRALELMRQKIALDRKIANAL